MNRTLMFYINSIHIGGAERAILQLAGRCVDAGYRSILVTSFVDHSEYNLPKGVERVFMEKEEVKQSRLRRNISRIKKLRCLCNQYHPEALISFMAEPNFRAVLATLGLPVKTIVSVRNDPKKEYAGKLFGFVGKHILPLADGCVFQTDDAKAWFPRRLQKKSTVIFNTVKESFYEVERNPIQGRIVTCGRLEAQKNHAMLIEAFAYVSQELSDATLLIYGEGGLRTQLQEKIDQLKLSERIILMGQSSNIENVLSEADVFVLSSDYEGMPNALMEALAAGVPCISTDCPCGGPRMLIKNGNSGILVTVGDTHELAKALKKLLNDKEYAHMLGENAHNNASLYAPEKVFTTWKDYIEKIIKET